MTTDPSDDALSDALDHAIGILPACLICGRTVAHYHMTTGEIVIFGRAEPDRIEPGEAFDV
jgi:hypothetical protein